MLLGIGVRRARDGSERSGGSYGPALADERAEVVGRPFRNVLRDDGRQLMAVNVLARSDSGVSGAAAARADEPVSCHVDDSVLQFSGHGGFVHTITIPAWAPLVKRVRLWRIWELLPVPCYMSSGKLGARIDVSVLGLFLHPLPPTLFGDSALSLSGGLIKIGLACLPFLLSVLPRGPLRDPTTSSGLQVVVVLSRAAARVEPSHGLI